jgi:hypothetical protein
MDHPSQRRFERDAAIDGTVIDLRLAISVVLLATACGGPSTSQRAEDLAADHASADVRDMAAAVTAALRQPGSPQQALDAASHQAAMHGRWARVINATQVGQFLRIDVAAVGSSDAGGGLDAAHRVVRVCARLEGRPGPDAKVRPAALDCPADLPDLVPNLGGIDEDRPYPG